MKVLNSAGAAGTTKTVSPAESPPRVLLLRQRESNHIHPGHTFSEKQIDTTINTHFSLSFLLLSMNPQLHHSGCHSRRKQHPSSPSPSPRRSPQDPPSHHHALTPRTRARRAAPTTPFISPTPNTNTNTNNNTSKQTHVKATPTSSPERARKKSWAPRPLSFASRGGPLGCSSLSHSRSAGASGSQRPAP